MTWTIRKILFFVTLTFAVAMIGTLAWVTTTYQRFTSDTLANMSAGIIENLVHQKIENDHEKNIVPFVEEWSRLSTLSKGIEGKSIRKLNLAASRMFNTIEVGNGAVNLRNVVIYNGEFSLLTMALNGTGEGLNESPDYIERMKKRSLWEKRIGSSILWQTSGGRPVHSTIFPIGGFRLLGFIEFVTDPIKILTGLGDEVGGLFKLKSGTGEKLIESKPAGTAVAGLEDKTISEARDGDDRNLETLSVVIHGTDGGTWAFGEVTRDISEFKHSATALRNQAMWLVASISIGVFVLAWLLLHLSVFNRIKRFASTLGALADGITDFKIPATGNDEFGAMRAALESLRSAVLLKQKLQLKSDAELVTRKKMELELRDSIRQAEAANRAKSEFMSIMNHELRTPLTSSLGSLGLLNALMAEELSEEGRDLLEITTRNNEALLRLVNELLDYDKFISGTLTIETSPQDITALASNTIKDLQGYAQAQSVNFVFDENTSPLYAETQEHRFEQILRNLLSNAAKFSESGSEVVISIARKSEHVQVSVKDNGPGIPEEFRDHIFEQFTQADSSSTREYGGTGLGLAISKALTEAMGGKIEFETEVGVGSTFFISFPEMNTPPSPVS